MNTPDQIDDSTASSEPIEEPIQFGVRPLTAADQALLWDLLYLSLFVPEGEDPFERSVLSNPGISRYVSGWGRPTDSGYVAVSEDGRTLGAVWLRLLAGYEKGYGYVDDFTPELGMAVFPEFRGIGIGSCLLMRLFESVDAASKQISLSVARESPAVRLYLRSGFKIAYEAGTSVTMVRAPTQ